MRISAFVLVLASVFGLAACSSDSTGTTVSEREVLWQQGMDIEAFWLDYANSKGGLTYGVTSEYPEYDKVNEGDTMIVELAQGPCLMEFFHSRWRRANDVRRWGEVHNEYGGCPYVFD